MDGRIPARTSRLIGAILAAIFALAVTAGAASAESEVIYNNLPSPTPGNVASVAFESNQIAQFGGAVEFTGTNRKGGTLSIGMSSWACQKGLWTGTPECVTEPGAKFEWPITVSVNEEGPLGEVGALVTTVTKTEKLPYRPSENRFKCLNAKNEPAGTYLFKGVCYHGKYFKISVPMGRIHWPSKAIISVSYNTSDYGAVPQRPQACNSESGGCFYDALNVGLMEPPEAPTAGSDPQPNDAYQNTLYAPNYCDGGTGGTGTFRLDAGCWEGYQPMFEVKATP